MMSSTIIFLMKGEPECSGRLCWLPALLPSLSNWVLPRLRSVCFQWRFRPPGYSSPSWLLYSSGRLSRNSVNQIVRNQALTFLITARYLLSQKAIREVFSRRRKSLQMTFRSGMPRRLPSSGQYWCWPRSSFHNLLSRKRAPLGTRRCQVLRHETMVRHPLSPMRAPPIRPCPDPLPVTTGRHPM